MANERIYFQGLDGIRALAAFIVIVFHIDESLNLFGLSSLGTHRTGRAHLGVILFFVLSGYLITYLLLTEKKKFGRIDITKFYMRRILRIWPIYYIVLAVSFFLLSINLVGANTNIFLTSIFYSLFLSNVAFSLGFSLLTIAPLWSVAVEEQFYFFWPLLLNYSRKTFYVLTFFIIVYLALKFYLRFTENGSLFSLISMSAFDSMAVGGIGAYFVFSNSGILKLFYHPALQIMAWFFFVTSVLYKPFHIYSLIDKEIYSLFFLIIILNVSSNNKSLVKLNNAFFNLIGQISYGLYVYHMIAICILSYVLKDMLIHVNETFIKYVIVYFSVIFSTFIVAYGSYMFIEKRFLHYKQRFSKVLSYK